ncbi:MAG: L-threonylcarbamoyladenylate synthase [Elusimicrobiaceae bacterium]|nr:L-threonylcarbamoyladenylate synthase [Elusimicrobiaceae bacterium]
MSRTCIIKAAQVTAAEISHLAGELEQGAVAVLPTDTVYGLGTGAFCEKSIERIYQLKNRPGGMPLQLLAATVQQARQVAQFSAGAEKLATRFWPGGLTVILPPASSGKKLARGFAGLGLRVPACAVLGDILGRMAGPLACTSANLHGQPVVTDEEILLDILYITGRFVKPGGFQRD